MQLITRSRYSIPLLYYVMPGVDSSLFGIQWRMLVSNWIHLLYTCRELGRKKGLDEKKGPPRYQRTIIKGETPRYISYLQHISHPPNTVRAELITAAIGYPINRYSSLCLYSLVYFGTDKELADSWWWLPRDCRLPIYPRYPHSTLVIGSPRVHTQDRRR